MELSHKMHTVQSCSAVLQYILLGVGNLRHACHTWHAEGPSSRINFVMIHTEGIWTLTCIKIRMWLIPTCVLQSVCVHTMDFVSAHKHIN